MAWLQEKLTPNLPLHLTIMYGDQPRFNLALNETNVHHWLRVALQLYYQMFQYVLYDIIKSTKADTVDSLPAVRGQSVLRLPPYHPELTWGLVKNWVVHRICHLDLMMFK